MKTLLNALYINGSHKKQISLRLCAIKKSKEEIWTQEKRLKRLETRKQREYSQDTKFTHNYMFVITSLPTEVSTQEILACYRLRWQVELVFKRLKSLLQLGNIPTKTKESGEAWISGKFLLSLLTEKYLGDIDFSPSWNIRRESKYMERDQAGVIYNFYDDTSK